MFSLKRFKNIKYNVKRNIFFIKFLDIFKIFFKDELLNNI